MVGGLWAGLAEAVEEGFRDYDGGELEDVQRTGVQAGCVFLCLFACQGGDGANLLQSFAVETLHPPPSTLNSLHFQP
jgi:hypothetical protein